MKLVYWMLLGTWSSPALCRAQAVCPWINAVTAVDAPSGTFVPADQITVSKNECRFDYQEDGVAYELRVIVQETENSSKDLEMKQAGCTSKTTALKGLGNEAVMCGADKRSSRGEQVIGRVRDKLFVVDVSVKAGRGSNAEAKSLGDMATMIANQVAGNLF